MDNKTNNAFRLYSDIKGRTNGEIYIGVVGPVRTGKSTFIKNFTEKLILPGIEDPHEKERIIDEMPQSAAGKTVMTTEPKFIPKDAVTIQLGNNIDAKIRLIDCVGYVVKDAQGIYEDDKERLVKTPWFAEDIPFTKAAEYGTGKVIKDHSTIGIVITTDGTIGDFTRESYLEAEEKTINELKTLGKPFVVIVNTTNPSSEEAAYTVSHISEKYGVSAMAVNCQKLSVNDIQMILLKVLYEFPVSSIEFFIPKWIELLSEDNVIKQEIIECAKNILTNVTYIKDLSTPLQAPNYKYISKIKYDNFDFKEGAQRINFLVDEKYYYENLSELTGENIGDEYELISMIRTLSGLKKEYGRYIDAAKCSMEKGYGVVVPSREEIELSEPEVIKTGNKFGVKMKAQSPSVQMIRVTIGTEISPIVGSEPQAMDLMNYIKESKEKGEVWDTNIFGKSIGQLVEDGIKGKLQMINDDCQIKLQDTMQKVVNETNGGLVCLII
ncbi:MAG: stage IV sporulation protein A [Butyrivibrio sp.]